MQIFISIIASAAVVLASLFGAYQWLPMKFLDPLGEPQFGTTITTINGSDTLSASRTVINNNFTALNTGKIEISTTTLPLITTLAGLTSAASLSSIGTITTGVWNGTLINVNKGGTGSSTLAIGQVLLGSSTNAIGVVSGFGTSGQFLTSRGAGLSPTWQTSAIDTGIAYNWTGLHTFNATTTFNATSSFVGRITSPTATTTVYNDLLVMGSIKQNGVRYGATQKCMGVGTITSGSGANSVICGFQPSIVEINAVLQADTNQVASSFGYSNGTNHYAIGFEDSTSNINATTTSSYAIFLASGSSGKINATVSLTATGFNIDYAVGGSPNPALYNYVAW
jgi:hypothetical protein